MSLTKPTFVLVPGSFSPPSWYEKVTPFLEKAGYENVVVPLPSANSEGKYKTPPTMTDDAASIKAVISDLVNNGKEVIIVMHSYGGYPGTEATGGLAKADRQKQGKDGGVAALVYVAGWMPPVGKSIFELQGEPEMLKIAVSFGPPFSVQDKPADDCSKGEYTYMPPGDFYQYLFPELPEEEARNYTAQLENHSTVCWYGILTYPGYKYIPTTCLIPENDFIIATNIQKEQVAREEREGVKITVHELKGVGHAPIISIPEKVAEILIAVTKEI
jgi:pimeloyl-ACP methyl ester carboxylesterase